MQPLRTRSHVIFPVLVVALVAIVLAAGSVGATTARAVRKPKVVAVFASAHVQRGTGDAACPGTDGRDCKFPTTGNDAIVKVSVPVTFTTVKYVDIVAILAHDCLDTGEQLLVLSGVVASVSHGTTCVVTYHLSVANGNAQSDLDVFENRGPASFDAWFAPGSGDLRVVFVIVGGVLH